MKLKLSILSLLAIAAILPAQADEKGATVVPGKESTTTSVPQPLPPEKGSTEVVPDKVPGKASTTTTIPTDPHTSDGKTVPQTPSK